MGTRTRIDREGLMRYAWTTVATSEMPEEKHVNCNLNFYKGRNHMAWRYLVCCTFALVVAIVLCSNWRKNGTPCAPTPLLLKMKPKPQLNATQLVARHGCNYCKFIRGRGDRLGS